MSVPVNWSFKREKKLSIIGIKCDGPLDEEITPFIVEAALELIRLASFFYGRPYPSMPSFPTESTFCVSFSLVFLSAKNADNFFDYLKQRYY